MVSENPARAAVQIHADVFVVYDTGGREARWVAWRD